MTNQDENKNRNHINTGVSFNFIHYMANLMAKWVTFAPFLNNIPFTKTNCFCLKFFISYMNVIIVCIVPLHALPAGGNRYLKNAAWSRMINFLKLGDNKKNPEGNADWQAQVKPLRVKFVTHKCISQ